MLSNLDDSCTHVNQSMLGILFLPLRSKSILETELLQVKGALGKYALQSSSASSRFHTLWRFLLCLSRLKSELLFSPCLSSKWIVMRGVDGQFLSITSLVSLVPSPQSVAISRSQAEYEIVERSNRSYPDMTYYSHSYFPNVWAMRSWL